MTPVYLLSACFMCNKNSMDYLEDIQSKILMSLFGMNKMDIIGFRRLRTFAQLTFESFPQIAIQLYIAQRLSKIDRDDAKENLGVTSLQIMISIISSVIHTIVEICLLVIEKKAHRTTLLHYASVCISGSFNWVPYTNLYREAEEGEKLHNDVFDYENIST